MHILRAGTFTARSGQRVTLSEADLRGLSESYDEAAHKAPIVVGHPKHDLPAYGWVRRLDFTAAGVYAVPVDVEPQFAEMVRKGRFRKISASIYMPGHTDHPIDGATAPYLRHVGFLGAQPPAIRGLEEAALSDNAEVVTIDIELAAPESQFLPTRLANPQEDEVESIEQQQADLAERERKVKRREAKLEKAAAKARLKGFEEFAQGLEKDGRILPRHTDTIVGLLSALPADAQVEFVANAGEDPEDTPAVDALKAFLGELPKQVDYAERAGAERDTGTGEFSAPGGTPVGKQHAALHRKVLAFSEKHGVSYEEALNKVATP